MAATALTVHTVGRTAPESSAQVASNATDGNLIPNDGKVWFEYTNTDTSPHTLTVAFSQHVDGQAVTARSYTLAPSAVGKLGPWPVSAYGSNVLVTTASATVTLGAYKLGV